MSKSAQRDALWAILAAALVVTPLACGGGGKAPSNNGGSSGDDSGGRGGGSAAGKGDSSAGGQGGSTTGGTGGNSSTGGTTGEDPDASADNAATRMPKELGGTCSKSCAEGLTCDTTKYRGQCTRDCMGDTDCATLGGLCKAGKCYKVCTSATDCKRQGWTCATVDGKMFCDVDPSLDADAGISGGDAGTSGGDAAGTKSDGGGTKGDGGKKSD